MTRIIMQVSFPGPQASRIAMMPASASSSGLASKQSLGEIQDLLFWAMDVSET